MVQMFLPSPDIVMLVMLTIYLIGASDDLWVPVSNRVWCMVVYGSKVYLRNRNSKLVSIV
jgi:hypothetical protein